MRPRWLDMLLGFVAAFYLGAWFEAHGYLAPIVQWNRAHSGLLSLLAAGFVLWHTLSRSRSRQRSLVVLSAATGIILALATVLYLSAGGDRRAILPWTLPLLVALFAFYYWRIRKSSEGHRQ